MATSDLHTPASERELERYWIAYVLLVAALSYCDCDRCKASQ